MSEQGIDPRDDAGSGGESTGHSKTYVVLVIVVLIALSFILYVGGFTKGRENAEEADVEIAGWVAEAIHG